MIKLLLVDDESVTRRGLLRSVPWQTLGVGEIVEARDGVEALRLANQYVPDIVVTDVRMPKLNGIELAMGLRKLYPSIKLIFISGHSDKEYLKAAIRLGAIGYVEKPIDLSEITDAIRSAAEQARVKDAPPAPDFLPLVRQDMLYRLIKPGANVLDLQRGLSLMGTNLDVYDWYQAVIVKLDGGAELLHSWLERLGSFLNGGISGEKDGHIVALIQAQDHDAALAERERVLTWLRGQDDARLAFVAMGMPVQDMSQIHASYQQAVLALQRLFFLGYGSIATYHQNGREPRAMPSPEEEFSRLLGEERFEELAPCIERYCRDVAENLQMLVDPVKRVFMKLCEALLSEARRRHIPLGAPEGAEEAYFWSAISGSATLDQLRRLLLQVTREFVEEAGDARAVNRKIAGALRLIEEQYMNPSLGVRLLADQVRLTQTYLSALFKKSTGRTISEHLLELRIEKSKQLLIDSDIRLSEIAGRVGYYDANAYAKAFKRMTGISPAKFRERYAR